MRAFGRVTLVAPLIWASLAQSSAWIPGGAAGAAADSVGVPAATAAVAAAPDTSLAPSTAPPWNPPAPVAASEAWETVVRTPGIILSLPLVGLGHVAKSGLGYI